MPTKEEEKIILDAAMFLAHIAQGSPFPYKQKERCKETAEKLLEYIKKVDKKRAINSKKMCEWNKAHPERHRELNRLSAQRNAEKYRTYQREYKRKYRADGRDKRKEKAK